MAVRGWVSYWMLPIISGLVWLGMLLGMLLHWIIDDHSRRYPWMNPSAKIAFISHIGAGSMKPLFITGSVLTTVFLDLSFAAERWLRHRGRLARNTSTAQRVIVVLSIIFAIVGTAGLILLSIFDTAHHQRTHNICLALFIIGYMLSAICICTEYQRLGVRYREYSHLAASFWVKLLFVLVELGLAIGFGVCQKKKLRDEAAILEWVIALVFTFYVLSFVIDLIPAVSTKAYEKRYPKHGAMHEVEEASSNDGSRHNIYAPANSNRDRLSAANF